MSDLLALVRARPNRGNLHVFLGHPLSVGCDKTTLEPGNVASPGVWTCGISVWLEDAQGQARSAELLAAEQIAFRLDTTGGPVVESRYALGPVEVLHRTCHLGGPGAEGADFHQVTLHHGEPAAGTLCIVVRDVGPAGAKIGVMEWDGTSLLVDGGTRLTVEAKNTHCQIVPPDAGYDSPIAVLRVPLRTQDGASVVGYRVEHAFPGQPFGRAVPLRRPSAAIGVAEAFDRTAAAWPTDLPTRVFAPDPRIPAAFDRCVYHMLAAMECGLPRIGAVNYPHLWLRDGVIVLRALDLIGRHDLARLGVEHIAPLLFSGGFGAEADAPGQAIWAIVRHIIMTRNHALLRSTFPHLQMRIGWLDRMLSAAEPLYAVGQNRIPFYTDTAGIDLLCLPVQHGLIHGRMDWHTPDFFINCWTRAGYALAAEAAAWLGHTHLAEDWSARARQIDAAIAEHLLPAYGNDRDPVIAPYPSGALTPDALRPAFEKWYRARRLTPQGQRQPEKLWTYFEAAQIHNALLLGLKDLAWINLDGMLSDGPYPELSAYVEGPPNGNEMLPFRNGERRRGWLDPDRAIAGNMPHNWTSAEMITLIRDLFVAEEPDGTLVLGLGVPAAWLRPGASFGVKNLPIDAGTVTYTATVEPDRRVRLAYTGPSRYRCAFPTIAKSDRV